MKKRNMVVTFAVLVILGANVAHAKTKNCYDGKYYRFYNDDNFTDCVSIGWNNGGNRNFCLRPKEQEDVQVRSGDRACWSGGNYAPKGSKCFSITQPRCK